MCVSLRISRHVGVANSRSSLLDVERLTYRGAALIIWIMMVAALVPLRVLGAEARVTHSVAVFYSDELRATSLVPSVFTALSTIKGVTLVGQDRLDAAVKETAPSLSMEAAGVVGRLRLAESTGASELVWVSMFGAAADRRLRLVVGDGRTGVRLMTELLEIDKKSDYEVADRIKEILVDVHNDFPRGVTHVVGVEPLKAKSTQPEHGGLAGGYTQLLKQSLKVLAGVAVVDPEEAQVVLNGSKAEIFRQPVLSYLVDGEIEFSGGTGGGDKIGSSRISLNMRVVRSATEVVSLQRGAVLPVEGAAFLAAELPNVIFGGKAGAASLVKVDQQFDRFVSRADAFGRLGNSGDAAPLREAALLVRPEAVEQRCKLIDDYGDIVATAVPNFSVFTPVDLENTPNLRTIKRGVDAYVARLVQVEQIVRQRGVPSDQALLLAGWAINLKVRYAGHGGTVGGRYCVLGEKDLSRAEDAKEQFVLNVLPGLRAWLMEAPQWGLAQNWENLVIEATLRRQDRYYRTKGDLDFIARVLIDVFPEAGVLDGSSDRVVKVFFEQQVDSASAFALAPVATETDWLDFLSGLEKSKRSVAVRYGQYGRSVFEPGRFSQRHSPAPEPSASSKDEGLVLNRRAFWGTATWTVPQKGGTVNGTRYLALDFKIRCLDGKTIPSSGVVYSVGRGWYGPMQVVPCGKGLDVWRYPGAILFMRQPGILEEVLLDNMAEFEDVRWDGNFVWITSRLGGVWVVKPDGRVVAHITAQSGLPPADQGLVVQPLSSSRAIAIGSYGEHRRVWCAVLQCDGRGAATVKVFHEAKRSVKFSEKGADFDVDPAICFRPAWLHDYQAKDGSRRILVGRDTTGFSGQKRPLEINPVTLEVAAFGRQLQGPASNANSNFFFSRAGFLVEGSSLGIVLYPPAGDRLDNGKEFKVLCSPRGNGGPEPVFFHDGWLYATGSSWHRIDPKTWAAQLLDSELQKPWRTDRCVCRLGVSSHYGLLAWDDGVRCQIAGTAPRPTVGSSSSARPLASGSVVSKGISLFSNPSFYSGKALLLTLEGQGNDGAEVRSLDGVEVGVRFELLKHDTMDVSGAGPIVASATNDVCPREFEPKNSHAFLRNASGYVSHTDMKIRFSQLLKRVSFEIYSGKKEDDARELSFELYRFNMDVGRATVKVRGTGRFCFYGIESMKPFDSVVIRQAPHDCFDVENLRYELFPE